jgi:hypothetical protein
VGWGGADGARFIEVPRRPPTPQDGFFVKEKATDATPFFGVARDAATSRRRRIGAAAADRGAAQPGRNRSGQARPGEPARWTPAHTRARPPRPVRRALGRAGRGTGPGRAPQPPAAQHMPATGLGVPDLRAALGP